MKSLIIGPFPKYAFSLKGIVAMSLNLDSMANSHADLFQKKQKTFYISHHLSAGEKNQLTIFDYTWRTSETSVCNFLSLILCCFAFYRKFYGYLEIQISITFIFHLKYAFLFKEMQNVRDEKK